MVFLKTRIVKGQEYYYATEAVTTKDHQKQRSVYYFGKRKPSKYEWEAVLHALLGKDDYPPEAPLIDSEQAIRIESLNERMKKEFSEMSASEKKNFFDRFYNDYIYNTNSIEGSTLTPDETFLVTHKNQSVKGKSLKEIYMARNLMSAINFLDAYTGDFTVGLMKKLHAIVQEGIQPKEELGVFKKRQNYILGTEFLPTPPVLVNSRISGLVRWYGKNKQKYHPFELASLIHLRFVSIHPFIDGNGSTARLLHNLVLKGFGFVPINYRTTTSQDYYSTLRAAQIYRGHKPFLDHSINGFIQTYEGY